MEDKLRKIFYSPRGYWRGKSAITKLAEAANVPRKAAKTWLEKQAIWQIYLPPPKRIRRPIFDENRPNAVHQADILFLPHDKINNRTFKYALTIIDVASRYKEAEPLPDKKASTVSQALRKIYKRSPLKWPNLLQVDAGREFFGEVTQLLNKNNVKLRRGIVGVHRQQALVERFNRTLAERLFGHQYYQEMMDPKSKRSYEWVKRLPEVTKALNNEVTRLINKKPSDAIKSTNVMRIPAQYKTSQTLSADAIVRYLYSPGELEGGNVRRATDPVWSITVHRIASTLKKTNQPTLYYLENGPKRSFVREELQVVR
jgi:transposase InsO family protein